MLLHCATSSSHPLLLCLLSALPAGGCGVCGCVCVCLGMGIVGRTIVLCLGGRQSRCHYREKTCMLRLTVYVRRRRRRRCLQAQSKMWDTDKVQEQMWGRQSALKRLRIETCLPAHYLSLALSHTLAGWNILACETNIRSYVLKLFACYCYFCCCCCYYCCPRSSCYRFIFIFLFFYFSSIVRVFYCAHILTLVFTRFCAPLFTFVVIASRFVVLLLLRFLFACDAFGFAHLCLFACCFFGRCQPHWPTSPPHSLLEVHSLSCRIFISFKSGCDSLALLVLWIALLIPCR